MALREYNQKRDFRRTPEPPGRERNPTPGPTGGSYLIQKHAATRLHYDFRIELDGVLKSWAVPKGPSLDPGDRRLAVHVEDHPLEYGSFEGTIPKGQYGGGTVLLWDRGRWEPVGDARKGYRGGRLKFLLHGEKLRGGWTLVRMGGKAGAGGAGHENWLLIKEKDAEARSGASARIVEKLPASVKSGRSMEGIAAAVGRRKGKPELKPRLKPEPEPEIKPELKPRLKPEPKLEPVSRPRARTGPDSDPAPGRAPGRVPGARKGKLPGGFEAQLATLVAKVPAGEEWVHEIKFDGYRALCFLERGNVRILSRNGKDWTARFGSLARALAALPARSALLDGEIVILRPDGTSSFQELQEALSEGRDEGLTCYLFDLMHLDGYDLTAAALLERKRLLGELLAGAGEPLRLSAHQSAHGEEFARLACRHALEGVVSKRGDRPYRGGRGRDWVKTKCIQSQELVIGGWLGPSKGGSPIAALLLGVNDGEGRLVYAGKVGTGFTARSARELHASLSRIEREDSPFTPLPPRAVSRAARWVEPRLVAEVEFTEWTRDGLLRHPSFEGLREDKKARDVVREKPAPAPAAAGAAAASRKQLERVAGVRLTHPERVLYPEQGLTKLGLARYYESVAAWLLPHVSRRPLSLVRCPEGQGKACFYQKHVAGKRPEAIHGISIREKSGTDTYLWVDSLAGVVELVQMGVLEIHPWGSRVDDVERPDRLTFDLDPDPDLPWARVIAAAKLVRERLAALGLVSFVKTTGGKGLHVVVPIRPALGWDEVKDFTRRLVLDIARERPQEYTATLSKAARKGKVFLDYLRNGRGATAVAAYSTRARPGAPVATPIAWEELKPGLRAGDFSVENLPERLARLAADPWADFLAQRQPLTRKMLRAVGVA